MDMDGHHHSGWGQRFVLHAQRLPNHEGRGWRKLHVKHECNIPDKESDVCFAIFTYTGSDFAGVDAESTYGIAPYMVRIMTAYASLAYEASESIAVPSFASHVPSSVGCSQYTSVKSR